MFKEKLKVNAVKSDKKDIEQLKVMSDFLDILRHISEDTVKYRGKVVSAILSIERLSDRGTCNLRAIITTEDAISGVEVESATCMLLEDCPTVEVAELCRVLQCEVVTGIPISTVATIID